MKKYPKLVEKLDGLILIHYSKMAIGQEYICEVHMKRKARYPAWSVNKGRSRIRSESFYLVEANNYKLKP